MLRLQERDTKY